MDNTASDSNGGHYPAQMYASHRVYPNIQAVQVSQESMVDGFNSQSGYVYTDNARLYPRHSEHPHSFQYQQPTPQPSFQVHNPFVDPQPHFTSVKCSQRIINPKSTASPKSILQEGGLPSPPLDYSAILLSLAEEYLAAAYGSTSKQQDRSNRSRSGDYYGLVATALACLESVLAKCKLQPGIEVTVRLRYATVLFEETENAMEAEEALNKGIAIADRHKLLDLKYNMQHLLVRILFQNKTPASFRFLDRVMKDAEAYQHWAWVYAFGFLKVSLHLEIGLESRQNIISAFSTLGRLTNLAETRGDAPVLAITTALKAWVSLKTSNSAESFEEAQTSLAIARGLQGTPALQNVPQIAIMIAFVDLCCCLQYSEPAQANEKMKHMHDALSLIPEAVNWLVDGSFSVPLQRGSMPTCRREDGIVRSQSERTLSLMFYWLPKEDIYTVGYLLSGIALSNQAKQHSSKAEEMLRVGIKKVTYDQQQSDVHPRPIVSRVTLELWRQHLASYMRLHLAFMLCTHSDWDVSIQHLNDFHNIAHSWSSVPPSLSGLSSLLTATYLQGTGSLDDALALYRNVFRSHTSGNSCPNPMLDDISRMAALNSILILRGPSRQEHDLVNALFAGLSQDCASHPNRQIQAAYHLVHSMLLESSTIIGRKQTLQLALNAAKANPMSLCVALSLMHWYFFRDQVSEQAEKSARAAQNMAHKVENKMWISATAGMVGDHLEAAGRPVDAAGVFGEGWEATKGFPQAVKARLGWIEKGWTDVEMPDVR